MAVVVPYGPVMGDPLLTAIENLSRFHREHEKFYAQARGSKR